MNIRPKGHHRWRELARRNRGVAIEEERTMSDSAAFARTVYEAFNRGDLQSALDLAAPDVEVVNIAWGMTYHGHEGFRTFMQGWKTMDPDCRVDVVSQLPGADGVTNECMFRGTQVGPLNPPTGEIPPTGIPLVVPICEVWQIRDGKLTSLHSYSDGITVLAQLGLLPAPS
jgi:steroid delta-isomerase-like uncharacterized protein